jgi:hypothetical protein
LSWVQAIDVPRVLADALGEVAGEAAFCSGSAEIEIWVPDEYRARLELAAREKLQIGSLQFRRFNPEARMQVLDSAPDLALLAHAAIGRRSRRELQKLVTMGATHAGGGDLVDVLLPQHPSQAWRYEIDSVLAAGALVGISGVKRADDGTEQAFAHQLMVRDGRIEHLVEVI